MANASAKARPRKVERDESPANADTKQRIGTRCVSAHLPEDMYWQLKEIAVLQRVEMKMIIAEAANALFREHNKKVIEI